MLRRSAIPRAVCAIRLRGDPILAQAAPPVADATATGIPVQLVTQSAVPADHTRLTDASPATAMRNSAARAGVPLPAAIADLHAALADFRGRHGFGRGIAAPQLGYATRVLAIHLDGARHTLINPEYTWKSDAQRTVWDDCFSFPNELVRAARHESVSVRFVELDGSVQEWCDVPFDRAELLQHEMDHLDGVLSHDRVAAFHFDGPEATERVRDDDREVLRAVVADILAVNPRLPDDRIGVVPRAVFEKHRAVLEKLA